MNYVLELMQNPMILLMGLIGYLKHQHHITTTIYKYHTFYAFWKQKTQLSNCKTKLKLWRLPKIKASMKRWSASCFGPAMYMRGGGLWAKHMGLKQGAIGTTLGNTLGT